MSRCISYCDCGDVTDYIYFIYINGPKLTDLNQAVIPAPDCKAFFFFLLEPFCLLT